MVTGRLATLRLIRAVRRAGSEWGQSPFRPAATLICGRAAPSPPARARARWRDRSSSAYSRFYCRRASAPATGAAAGGCARAAPGRKAGKGRAASSSKVPIAGAHARDPSALAPGSSSFEGEPCNSATIALHALMPRLMRFSSSEIAMFFADHNPPHFHVLGREGAAQVRIDTLEVDRVERAGRFVRGADMGGGEPRLSGRKMGGI